MLSVFITGIVLFLLQESLLLISGNLIIPFRILRCWFYLCVFQKQGAWDSVPDPDSGVFLIRIRNPDLDPGAK